MKSDTNHTPGANKLILGDFPNLETALAWIARNYGTNFSAQCKRRIEQDLVDPAKEQVVISDVIGSVESSQRRIDIAQQGFRAKLGA